MNLEDNAVNISILIGLAVFFLTNSILEIHFFREIMQFLLRIFDTFAEYLGKYNTKRYIERIRKENIIKKKEGIFVKYNNLVEGVILDFNIPLTLEAFTSIICIIFALAVLVIVFFMKDITLSIVIAVSLFVGILTYFSMQSKSIRAERLDNIMDAEDVICPLARNGVLYALKKVLETDEYISPNIRPYFQQFVDNCENNGYSFKQAMTILNKQLGPKFDNFAKKSIVFEYNERTGMADIFLDIVDENAVLREMNRRKERLFHKMNRDFLIKTIIIILFFLYALSVPGFREFMISNNLGKLINTVVISVICLTFSVSQSLQGNLEIGGLEK